MKEALLAILMKEKQHISGEALSKSLGVSRTAIWKHMKQLKEEGYAIESVRNKGYLLKKSANHPVEEGLKVGLKALTRYETIRVYETIDSTNDEAKRLCSNGLMTKGLLVAREQTGGKGRRGRQWLSGKDDGIYMSLVLRPALLPIHASMLTLVSALATAEAIESITSLDIGIKWPNDLVIHGKKVAGILTEMSAEMDFIHYVVIGMGINVNGKEMPEAIESMATSLALEVGKEIDPMALIIKIMERFEAHYTTFLQEQSLRCMIRQYNRRCVNIGQALKVTTRDQEILGTGLEVTQEGALKIGLEDGSEQLIMAGEVSVRGLYGYI